MYSPLRNNKLIAVSCSLAVAGAMACAVAMIDASMPNGSLVGFLAGMALLGLVVTGVVIGYAWLCDQCEKYFSRRLDQFRHGRPNGGQAVSPGAAVSPRPTEPQVVGDIPTPDAPPLRSSRVRRTSAPRGLVSPKRYL
jgi:hypothetical protein